MTMKRYKAGSGGIAKAVLAAGLKPGDWIDLWRGEWVPVRITAIGESSILARRVR